MSSQSSRMPDEDTDDAEFMAESSGTWRAKGCQGCGQGPDNISRIDAIAIAAFLQRRFATLLASPRHSLRHRGHGRGSWSTLEPAALACDVLGAADDRLRDLFDEEAWEPVPQAAEPQGSVASAQTLAAVGASLAENIRRLTTTVAGATAEDWRRIEPDEGPTAGELVWLALHIATHHLEDAELFFDSASDRAPGPSPAPGLHSVRADDDTGAAARFDHSQDRGQP